MTDAMQELKVMPIWVLYRLKKKSDGRTDKVLFATNGKAAKSKDQKRRVTGYARVSTDSDEQFTSYTAQVDYYTKFIKENPDWEFCGIYTDEDITGTSTKHREGFNRMIEDALAGKIDLIVTKSVSRFARNTVDSLTTIRKLKEAGCECLFQKENILTFDSKGERTKGWSFASAMAKKSWSG